MNFSLGRIKKTPGRIRRQLFQFYKYCYQLSLKSRAEGKSLLFIFGCQRSGTTLTQRIFQRDIMSKVYGELSELSSKDPDRLRLNPLENVKSIIDNHPAPFVVIKPLVESQNALDLLSYFKGSKAVWLYRNYKDVASSNLRFFGEDNGVRDLRHIINGHPESWKAEKITNHVRNTILRYFSDDMNKYDAAALFWYARNNIYFDQKLFDSPDIMMCRYEDLVSDPDRILRRIYQFIDRPYPGSAIVSDVFSSSVGKGSGIELSLEIEQICSELLKKLDESYRAKSS